VQTYRAADAEVWAVPICGSGSRGARVVRAAQPSAVHIGALGGAHLAVRRARKKPGACQLTKQEIWQRRRSFNLPSGSLCEFW
jgi:hypothetical protein